MPDQDSIRIHSVELQNVLQFQTLELQLGKKATIISGKNETGKSSLIEAIKAGISGGSKDDMELLRGKNVDGQIKDREKLGKIIIRLDDEDVLTKKLFLDKASQLDTTNPDSTPGNYLAGILGAARINPVKFFNAKGEDRIESAMNVLPLEFDQGLFERIIGAKVKPSKNPLNTVDKWYEDFYKERTEANGAYKKAKLRADDMRRTLPLDDPETPEARIAELESERKAAEDKLRTSKDKLLVAQDKKKSELQAIRDAKIKEANDEYASGIELAQTKANAFLEGYNKTFADAVAAIDPELGKLKEKAQNFERVMEQHKILHGYEVDEQLCKEDWELKDQTVKKIEMFRETLIGAGFKQIEGMEHVDIKEDDIWLDGVKWPHVNKAKRLKFSNLMAEMSCGKLKIIFADDLESLDEDNYAWQLEHMKQKGDEGFQFVIAKVGTEEELSIETID